MQIQSSTVEENFVFGSPPLLNGFTYNTCRSQEGIIKANHDCFSTYNIDMDSTCSFTEDSISDTTSMNSNCQNKFSSSFGTNGYNRTSFAALSTKNNINQFSYTTSLNGRKSYADNGMRVFEQNGFKAHNKFNNELIFKKRKDLRVLKSVLSNERFREVVMKFGDGDEGGKEIVESVHKSMRNSNLSFVSCLFCSAESQVYENFPIVDGTLFLSPVKISKDCVKFDDKVNGICAEKYMCFVCVNCLEGKPNKIHCTSCRQPWNGSFFQVGTLYSYNILSAIPCCEVKVKCKNCQRPIINVENGDASTLYFSYFSSKTTCPTCQCEDFHYIKSLDTLTKNIY